MGNQVLGFTKITKKSDSKRAAPRFPLSSQASKPILAAVKLPSLPTIQSRKRKSIGKLENRSAINSSKPKPNLHSVKPKVTNLTTVKPKMDDKSTINLTKLTQSKSYSALKTPSIPRTSNPGLSRSTSVASKMSQPKTVLTAPRMRNKQESQESEVKEQKAHSVLKSRSPVPATIKSKP